MTMGALQQYLDLYREHGDLINARSCGALNALRRQAYDSLAKNPVLPRRGNEHYAVADVEEMLAPDYGLNLNRLHIDFSPAEAFRCEVPNMSTALFFLVNDAFARTSNSYNGLPQGVVVESLAKAAKDYADIVDAHYGRVGDMGNPIVALDTMLAQDGIFIYIPKGVRLEKPLQLVNILQNGMPLMAVRRILVVVEEDASGQLLVCDHTQNPDENFLALQTVEIVAGRNASFDIYDLEESTEKTTRLSALYVSQQEGSHVVVDGITLYNGNTRNEYYCNLLGEHAALELLGMGIEDCSRRLDTYSKIVHHVPNCKSNELFKYVADDKALCGFEGLILVKEGAHGTSSYQTNRNLLGSQDARVYSRPQLEIYNDDVKCSHGSAIGQLDETQLFYMRTRGVDEADARLLLKQAFMADVIEGVRLGVLRDRLRMLVERRFNGEHGSGCAVCSGCADDTVVEE